MDFTAIMDELIKFRDDKDFEQFHTTKNLSISICLKAAELLETFQWSNDESIRQIIKNDKTEIEEKLADIMIYLIYMCRNLDISSDSIEAAIYSRIIKESTNMHLTGQKEFSENMHPSKVIDFKHVEKSIIISLISSAVFANFYPALLEVAQLA